MPVGHPCSRFALQSALPITSTVSLYWIVFIKPFSLLRSLLRASSDASSNSFVAKFNLKIDQRIFCVNKFLLRTGGQNVECHPLPERVRRLVIPTTSVVGRLTSTYEGQALLLRPQSPNLPLLSRGPARHSTTEPTVGAHRTSETAAGKGSRCSCVGRN